MPFEKGHPNYPPKPGNSTAGRKRVKYQQVVTMAVRDEVDASILVKYHLALAKGHRNVRVVEDENEELAIAWDEPAPGGNNVSQDEITKSINWLADRGWGLPAQSIQVDANIRQHQTSVLAHVSGNVGELSAAKVAALRALLAGEPKALPPAATIAVDVRANAIDAESAEVEPVPVSSDADADE